MKTLRITTRFAKLEDLAEIQKMFVDTISVICKDDYSPDQIKVWTSSIENKDRWMDKLAIQYFRIAICENKIIGIASLEQMNYFDLLYVHKDFQRQGIASKLYVEIEKEALNKGATAIYSDVSKTAKPFFLKKGFKSFAQQTILIQGIEMVNFRMTKKLL
jgi:putative acetyltransferase